MMIGTTLNEFANGINHPEYEQMSDSELVSRTESLYPGRGNVVVAAFRTRTPDAKPFDIWSRIMSAPVREAAIAQARSKAALLNAPAFLYWFTWHTPIFDGRPRAFHCAELPFVFYNTDRCDNMTGGGPRARALAATIADTWIQFARTGNPNHAGIPQWSPVQADSVPTLIFNDNTIQALNPDGDERASLRAT
jgi:para-nitrobenzyl esterase